MNARSKLLKYESSGSFVFHGSPNNAIAVLEPRQATSFNKPDGEPAISASIYIEPAIFMSLISRVNGGAMGIQPTQDNKFGMVISSSIWEKALKEQWNGFVYVLDRTHFQPRDNTSWEWRSTKSIQSIDVIPMSAEDLKSNITILPDDEVQSYIDAYMRDVQAKKIS